MNALYNLNKSIFTLSIKFITDLLDWKLSIHILCASVYVYLGLNAV